MELKPGRERPLPRPSWLTEPFWSAAAEGRLIVQRCGSCGCPFFRPEAACPKCLSEAWSWEDTTGTGTVESFTVVHRPAFPGMEVPYVVADVLLAAGVHLMTNIIGCEDTDVEIGMAVEVEFVETGGLWLPFFRPAAVKTAVPAPGNAAVNANAEG